MPKFSAENYDSLGNQSKDMNLNSLQPKNPLVPAPIGMGTSQISMPESSPASLCYAVEHPGFSSPFQWAAKQTRPNNWPL
jgi:hypothetical protein